MITAPPSTAETGAGPTPPNLGVASPNLPRRRMTAPERRIAWAKHRREMTRLVTAKADWVPVVVFASVLMTPEARLDLAGFQLYPYRLALIAAIPFMFLRIARERAQLSIGDSLFLFASVWMFIATALHYSLSVTLKTGGSTMLDTVLAYAVGRVFFRSSLDVRQFLYRVSPLLAVIAGLMLLESVSHRYIVRPLVGAVTGYSPQATIDRVYELRFGLLRAMGPFLHPIAAGLFFGSLVPLFIAADLPKRRWFGLLACFGGLFAWSSAAIVSIVSGLGLGLYDFVQKRLRFGWMPLIGSIIIALFLIELFTQSGVVKFLIRYASFNPQTGYFRLLIWEYGTADVARSPWIGIGILEEYARPAWMHSNSVDNYWLLLALRFGIPCSVTMLLAVVFIVSKLGFSRQGQELGALGRQRMASGVAISISILYLVLFTVSPWGGDMSWIIMLLGMAAGLADPVFRPVRR